MTSYSLLLQQCIRFQFDSRKRDKDTKGGWVFKGLAKVVSC